MEVAIEKRPMLCIFGNDYDTPDGTCIRDYIHVTDLADAHVKALKFLKETGQSDIFNLGTQNGISVLEMVQATEEVIGRKIKSVYESRRPGDPSKLTACAEKAQNILHWQPLHSSVENIIRTTWAVYQKK